MIKRKRKLRHIEEKLREAHSRLEAIIDFLPDATFVVDTNGKVIAWNKTIEEMTGISKADMIQKGNYEYAIPFYYERRPILIDFVLSAVDSPEMKKYDYIQRIGNKFYAESYVPETYKGKGAYLAGTASVLLDKSGNILGAIESIRDITDQKLMEDELLEKITDLKQAEAEIKKLNENLQKALQISENRFRAAQDISLEAFTILRSIRDDHGKIIDFEWTYANHEAARILKQPIEKLLGQRLLEVLPGNHQNLALFDRYVRIVESGLGNEIELEYQSDGITGWFRNSTVKLDDGVAVSFSDITQRKNAEVILKQRKEDLERLVNERTAQLITVNEQLKSDIMLREQIDAELRDSLLEKVVLLREIHHRVKNNIASIIGIIRMQRRNINDPSAIEALTVLESRIISMSIINEKLYQSKNLSRVDFKEYLDTLISHIKMSFILDRDIKFHLDVKGIEMVLDYAIPCGLIVNELLTNAIKYAFPEKNFRSETGSTPEISVTAECNEGAYTLTVSDNGIGLPADIDLTTTKTLGFHLVGMISQHQLGGSIKIDRANGTKFILKF